MNQVSIEQALLNGLLRGVEDHVAKIVGNIIGDGGSITDEVDRFSCGLKASRDFYEAALADIKKEFGESRT
jgi:hypothetical protein